MERNVAKGTIIGERVLRSTISNSAGKFITLLSFFLLTPFVLHRLGASQYGLWALVGSALAYGALLDFGILRAVIKYVAEFTTQGRSEDAKHLLASALSLYSMIGIAVILLSLVFAPLFPRVFNVPPDERSTAAWLVVLLGIGLGIELPCMITTAVLRGLQRYDIVSMLSVIATILYVAGVVIALSLGGGLLDMAAISIGVALVMQPPAIWFIKRIAPELHVGWRGAERSWMRKVASFGSWLFLLDLGTLVRTKTDVMVIGSIFPIKVVTPYALARKMGESGQIMTDQFMKVILPLASELHAGNDLLRLRSLYTVGTRLTLGIFLPVAFVLIALARQILTVWVGPEYGNYSSLVAILVFAYLIDVLVWPAANVLQGIAQHRLLARVSFYGAILNIPLTIFLTYKFGVIGAAFAALASTAGVALGFVLPYSMRTIGISAKAIFREILVPALLPLIPMAIALHLMKQLTLSGSMISIMMTAGISGLTYVIAYLSLSASELERRTCWGFALSALRFAEARLKRS
jgi:O-antigen/teichoic acid export membrane protein